MIAAGTERRERRKERKYGSGILEREERKERKGNVAAAATAAAAANVAAVAPTDFPAVAPAAFSLKDIKSFEMGVDCHFRSCLLTPQPKTNGRVSLIISLNFLSTFLTSLSFLSSFRVSYKLIWFISLLRLSFPIQRLVLFPWPAPIPPPFFLLFFFPYQFIHLFNLIKLIKRF